MQLTTVVGGCLYAVKHAVPAALVQDILAVDWADLAYASIDDTVVHRRRRIEPDPPVTVQFTEYIQQQIIPTIEQECGIKFDHPEQAFVQWWLDEPDFRAVIHHDGPLPSSMQLYWTQEHTDLGTTFYHDRARTSTVHRFASQVNSGYLMLNDHPDHVLWHNMERAVPPGYLRLSSYIWFGTYQPHESQS